MISKERLELIEKKAKDDPNIIFTLTDAELVSYGTYLHEKIKKSKEILQNKKAYCKSLFKKLKNS